MHEWHIFLIPALLPVCWVVFFLNFIFISERHINNLSNLAVIHIVVTLMSFSLNLEKARRKNELHFLLQLHFLFVG